MADSGPHDDGRFSTGEFALEIPPEPVSWRQRVRGEVLDEPDRWPGIVERGGSLADWLWDQWHAALEQSGVSSELLCTVIEGYRGELWLWVMGERTWMHIGEGLRDRLRRRAEAERSGTR